MVYNKKRQYDGQFKKSVKLIVRLANGTTITKPRHFSLFTLLMFCCVYVCVIVPERRWREDDAAATGSAQKQHL